MNDELTNTVFEAGDRVMTPCGPGTINYKRLSAPDFLIPCAYSIKLDCNASNPVYIGTIYQAQDVKPLKADQ